MNTIGRAMGARAPRGRRWRLFAHAVLLSVASGGASACRDSALEPLVTPEVWVYRAEQQLPTPARLEGELTVQRVDGERFEGRLDLRRALPTGAVERLGGFVRGRRDARTLSFEFALDGGVMRHVGTVDGVRRTGTWIDEGALGGAIVSGVFTLEPRS
jgi:hypothetical protein